MKNLFTLFTALIISVPLFAQKASVTNEKMAKDIEGPAITIILDAKEDNVEDVLEERFKKLKSGREKGFTAYEAQIIEEISPKTMDFYWDVESAGKNQTKVIFFMSYGNFNFIDAQDDASAVSNAKAVLEGLAAEVRQYELNIAIAAQQEVIEDHVDDLEDLEKDKEKLIDDMEDLKKELEENKKEQEANLKAIEDQKKVLEEQKKLLAELQKKLGQVK